MVGTTSRSAGLKGEMGLLLVALIWGVNFSVMKNALADLDPYVFNAFRFTLSVVVLGTWTVLAPDKPRGDVPRLRGLHWRVFALGVGGHGLYQALFVIGLSQTTSGNSALIITTSPLWTGFIAHAVGIERIRSRAWLGLFVAFAGTALLVVMDARNGGAGESHLTGDLLTLGAAMAWGAYTVFSQPLIPVIGPLSLTCRSTLFALPVLWLLALPHLGSPAETWALVRALDGSAWFALVFSGFFSTGLAYVLWNRSIRRVGPSQTAIFVNLVPVVALACGALFLGEAVTPWQLLGGAFILLGILQMRRAR